MANFTRIEATETMKAIGAVPVFYHQDVEVCKKMITACYEAGARVFEFTNRGDRAHEVFRDLSLYAKEKLPGMILGIGSIIDPATASLYLQLGADFIVSPIVHQEIAKVCNRRKVAWIPGCGSVTEISFAEELGAEVVKLFPGAQVGGAAFVKAVRGPLPWSSIMPTGGVNPTEEGLKEWFDAGVHCVGLGSKLFVKKQDGSFDYESIKDKLEHSLQLIKALKS